MTLESARSSGAVTLGYAAVCLALLFVIFGLLKVEPAEAAVTCTVTGPAMTFGTINPFSGFPYSTSGNASYSCTNNAAAAVTVQACVSVGTGTGGTTAANRTLASGADKLPIQITGGAASPAPIGNGTSYPMQGPLAFTIGANATATGTYALAVTLSSPGVPPPPGNYISSFAGIDAQDFYTITGAPATCAALIAGTKSTAQANFSVAATVPTQCSVAATGLAFPTASVLATAVSATASITITCNAAVPVTVALDNGAIGTAPTARRMQSGGNAITYGIYRDAAASQPWGNTNGSNTASSVGTSTLLAYGRVAAQASPPPGAYSDVVNVIITY